MGPHESISASVATGQGADGGSTGAGETPAQYAGVGDAEMGAAEGAVGSAVGVAVVGRPDDGASVGVHVSPRKVGRTVGAAVGSGVGVVVPRSPHTTNPASLTEPSDDHPNVAPVGERARVCDECA